MVDVVDSAVVVFSLFPTFRKSRRMRPVGPGATAGQFRSLTSCISFHFAETFFYRLVSLGNTSAGRNGIIGQIISAWRQSFGMKNCTEKEAEIFVQLFEDRFFSPIILSHHFQILSTGKQNEISAWNTGLLLGKNNSPWKAISSYRCVAPFS